MRKERLLLYAATVLLLSTGAHAEDKLKPIVDQIFDTVKSTDDAIGKAFFRVFPTYEDSLNKTMHTLDRKFPAVKDFHWIFYVAVVILILVLLARLAEMSQRYIINTLLGITLLLVLIHLLGVELKITFLTLIATALFGVPGVIVIVILHYAGLDLPL